MMEKSRNMWIHGEISMVAPFLRDEAKVRTNVASTQGILG